MKENIWKKYWNELKEIDVLKVIENDHYYRLLKRLVRLRKNGRLNIIEVGCGSGIRTLALLREFENYPMNAILVDISLGALLFAKKNAEKNKINANFILADGFKLPFRSMTFDIVWNEGVNEHFDGKERQKIFEEMSRCAREGGQVIVIVPNALNLPYRITKKILEIKGKWIYGLEKPYTIFELKYRMKSVGITSLTASGAGVITSINCRKLKIPKRAKGKMSKKAKRMSRAIRKVLRQIENICEIFCPFLLKDIGVGGTKEYVGVECKSRKTNALNLR